MTTWSKTPPSEPGYCWARRVNPTGAWARSKPMVVVESEYAQHWAESQHIDGDHVEFGPRIPTPAQIEAAREALLAAGLRWNAVAWEGVSDGLAETLARGTLGESRVYWLTAELPVPEAQEIAASVEEAKAKR